MFPMNFPKKIQSSFFTGHLWTAASKLVNTSIRMNIHDILRCPVEMCIYIKDWVGGK